MPHICQWPTHHIKMLVERIATGNRFLTTTGKNPLSWHEAETLRRHNTPQWIQQTANTFTTIAPPQPLSGQAWLDAQKHKLNDVTIIIPSCDKYSVLWPTFFACLWRFWPELKTSNAHIPILLSSGTQTFKDARITNLPTHDSTEDWSATLLTLLNAVKTRFVLLLKDDYFLCRPVHEAFLDHILQKMKTLPVTYIEVGDHKNPGVFKTPYAPIVQAVEKPISYTWRVSSLACMWNKEDFKALLQVGENPWQCEDGATVRSRAYEQKTGKKFLYTGGNPPILHLNAVWQGQLECSVQRWFALQGLPLVPENGPFPLRHKRHVRFGCEPYVMAMLQASGCMDDLPA